jgi:hypothetical protein
MYTAVVVARSAVPCIVSQCAKLHLVVWTWGSLFGVVYFAISSFREYLDKPWCVLPHMCTCMEPLRDCSLLRSVEIGPVAHPDEDRLELFVLCEYRAYLLFIVWYI